MAIKITDTASILGSLPNGNSKKITTLTNQLNTAVNNVSNGVQYKYDSREKLEKSGTANVHDNIQRSMLIAQNSKTNIEITKAKLDYEKGALKDINDAVLEFETERLNISSSSGTNEERADRALQKIERIVSRQDSNGHYVFGGSDPYTDPLTRIDNNGNVVKISLTQMSNLVEGIATTNYAAESAPNDTIVSLSSRHEVRESFLYPSIGALSDTITYLNMYKSGNYTNAELDVAKAKQIGSRGELTIAIGLEIEKTEIARDVNKSDIQQADNLMSSSFKGDLVEASAAVSDLMNSVKANVTLSQVYNKTFNTILDNTRI